MNMEQILQIKNRSVLLIEERSNKDIVVGAPHHAPLGLKSLPCPDHIDSDENTGLLGYYLSQLLDCPLIIACNYFIDSNKDENTDYFKKLVEISPRFLVELHGHGGNKANFDIEISSGNPQKSNWASDLARKLKVKMDQVPYLAPFTISGDFQEIYFKASRSKSIVDNQWIAFHIEIPFSIRRERSLYIPFCKILAECLTWIQDND